MIHPISKDSQTQYRGKKNQKGTQAEIPEEQLQKQLDDMLKVYGIRYLRFPDKFFRWLRAYSNASIGR